MKHLMTILPRSPAGSCVQLHKEKSRILPFYFLILEILELEKTETVCL